jgi:cytochrome c-type biogenesis protein CcmH
MKEGLLPSLCVALFLALSVAVYPFRKKPLEAIGFLCLLIVVVVLAYWRWGGWFAWSDFLLQKSRQQQVQERLKTVHGAEDLIRQLKQAVQRHPDSARGWYLLGRLYASQQDWMNASEAFAMAYRLQPKQSDHAVNYAHSLWQLNHQQFNALSRKVLHEVLQSDSHQIDALGLLAMDAYARGAYQEAIRYWESVLTVTQLPLKDAQAIRKAIVKAQNHLLKRH